MALPSSSAPGYSAAAGKDEAAAGIRAVKNLSRGGRFRLEIERRRLYIRPARAAKPCVARNA